VPADSGNRVPFAVFGSRPAVEFNGMSGLAKFGIHSFIKIDQIALR
jgi:hypothetical protein